MVRILIGCIVAVTLHLLLGWPWSVGGGIATAMYNPRRAWIAGGIAVGLGWTLFVAHALLTAPEPAARLLAIMGGLFGNIPGVLIPVITVFVGGLLGIAGGILGTSIHAAFMSRLSPES